MTNAETLISFPWAVMDIVSNYTIQIIHDSSDLANDLLLTPPNRSAILEECFLRLLPEYEWTQEEHLQGMWCNTVEDLVEFFEDIIVGEKKEKPAAGDFFFNFAGCK